MGGCRCCFQGCKNTTTLAKETNTSSHFFHFPIRDLKRCVQWAIYANKMDFLKIPIDKLKNKVICDQHFSENHFMNYTRSKLNKTTAIPILYINENKEEIDLLERPTQWVMVNQNADIPEQFKNMMGSIKTDISEESIDYKPPPQKKIKSEIIQKQLSPQQGVRILNKMSSSSSLSLPSSSSSKVITVKQVRTDNSNITQKVVNLNSQKQLPTTVASTKIQKIPVKVEAATAATTTTTYQVKADTQKSVENLHSTSSDFSLVEGGNELMENDSFEYFTVVASEEQSPIKFTSPTEVKSLVKPVIPDDDDIKELLAKTSNEISDIKKMLNTTLSKTLTPVKVEESSSITQSQFNKVQLFNQIKRYLSPSLAAILRMELFAGTKEHEYKRDEKIVCIELLKLGTDTYDFFNEIWRLRLPNKEQVIAWQNEEVTDDDAC